MKTAFAALLLALPGILAAQATTEAALSTGGSATAAAGSQKAGKSIAGAFGNLNRVLQRSEASKQTAHSSTTTISRASKTEPAKVPPGDAVKKPAVTVEDPSGIREGMESAELLRRFGPPSLKLTTGPGEELLAYGSGEAHVDVTLRGGTVANVQRAGASAK